MWTNEKIPTPSRTRTHRPPGYQPGNTLGGDADRYQSVLVVLVVGKLYVYGVMVCTLPCWKMHVRMCA